MIVVITFVVVLAFCLLIARLAYLGGYRAPSGPQYAPPKEHKSHRTAGL